MSCSDDCLCNKRGIDYYGVLLLKKDCTDLEIKTAFRRLAIRYNPKRTKDESFKTIFALITEAYDVLSDPVRRTIYDQYGEKGLKNGVPGMHGYIQPYIYHGEPMRTYREFFGTETPYADLLHVLSQPSSVLEFPEGQGLKRKEEPLIKTLYLTLSEIFHGGIKKMKIQRLVLVEDDKCRTVTKEKILTIPIKPGIPTGTRIIFPNEGDQGPTKIPARDTTRFIVIMTYFRPNIVHLVTGRNGLIVEVRVMSLFSLKHVSVADVIFITEDRPHETFQREGSNLHMVIDIFLREALTGTVVTVNTLDDRTLRIPITSVITPDYRKHVPSEGLPLPETPKKRGSLIIMFNIEFPVYLPVSNKNQIKQAFDLSHDASDAEYVHRFILANKMRKNVDFDVTVRRNPDDHEAKQLEFICDS